MDRLAARAWFWIAFAAALYGPWIDTRTGSGNVASDLAAIESLVERGTFYINGSAFADTIDKFKLGDKFFSQKSPIFHLVGAAIYAPMRAGGASLARRPEPVIRALVFGLVIAPMGWLLAQMFNHPWARGRSRRFRWALTLAFALGTPLTTFAVTLNHYAAAAAFLFAASVQLAILFPTRAGGMAAGTAAETGSAAGDASESALRRAFRFALAGFWVSASLASDVPPAFMLGAAVAAVLVAMAARGFARGARGSKGEAFARLRELGAFCLGAAPLIALYAGLNVSILGSPLPPNLHESEMLYYEGSFWSEQRAAAERGEPGYYQASYARRLAHATLGHKGLYWMTPLLALATVLGARAVTRDGNRLALAWAIFPPAAVAVTMVWAFDLSGGAYGVRHVFATLPPLFSVLALRSGGAGNLDVADGAGSGRGLRLAGLGALAAWGAVIAWVGVMNPWSHNTLSAYPPVENLARWAISRGPGKGAIPTAWIERAIETTSVTPAVGWLDLGLERMRRREWGAAETAFARAISADPKTPLPLYHMGMAQDQANRPDRAIETYRRLLAMEPENVGAWNNLGFFGLRAGRADVAREAYRRSLDLKPENASGLWGSAMLERSAGVAPETTAAFKRGRELYPNDPRFGR